MAARTTERDERVASAGLTQEWARAIVEAVGPSIPPHALTVNAMVHACQLKKGARNAEIREECERRVAAGELCKAQRGRSTYYWPKEGGAK